MNPRSPALKLDTQPIEPPECVIEKVLSVFLFISLFILASQHGLSFSSPRVSQGGPWLLPKLPCVPMFPHFFLIRSLFYISTSHIPPPSKPTFSFSHVPKNSYAIFSLVPQGPERPIEREGMRSSAWCFRYCSNFLVFCVAEMRFCIAFLCIVVAVIAVFVGRIYQRLLDLSVPEEFPINSTWQYKLVGFSNGLVKDLVSCMQRIISEVICFQKYHR